MKKILILTTLLSPLLAAAQYQAGLNIGVAHNTSINSTFPYLSGRVQKESKYTVIGFGLDLQRYSGTVDIPLYNANGQPSAYTDDWSYIALNPNVYGNYKLPLTVGHLYAGVSVGYYFASMPDYEREFVFTGTQPEQRIAEGSRPIHRANFGAQLGYSVGIAKKLTLNVEGAWRRVTGRHNAMAYFPVSAGLRYTFKD